MKELLTAAREFLKDNPIEIILVSIIFSLIMIYIIINDIRFPKKKYIRKKTILIN